MATLGTLERRVMETLWTADASLCAPELGEILQAQAASDGRGLAQTTILTVLSRLERKGLVVRDRSRRPHRYRAARAREEHAAELMHEALGRAADRQAALARFLGSVSPAEADTIRRLLDDMRGEMPRG